MHINEVATYYEMYGMVWKYGFVDEGFLFDWVPASLYWQRIGATLVAARTLLGEPELWVNFEALAAAQDAADPSGP